MTAVAAPKNRLVALANTILKTLIEGLGEDAAIALAISLEPGLAAGFGNTVLTKVVGWLGGQIDPAIAERLDNVIIRQQNAAIKTTYDSTIDDMKKVTTDPGVSNADKIKAIQAARDAADHLINRNR